MSETRMLEFVVYGGNGTVVAYCDTYRDAMLVFLGRLPDDASLNEERGDDGTLLVTAFTPSIGGGDRIVHCILKRRVV